MKIGPKRIKRTDTLLPKTTLVLALGQDQVAVESDGREGICGTCSLMINGQPQGPEVTTTCQLHMRSFKDGDTITVEPWRADPFPGLKDLVVDRSAFDRIIASGGYISVNTEIGRAHV